MSTELKFIRPRALKARRTPRIVLPAQPVNDDAVRAFMRDCMVPILAKEFLRLRDSSMTDVMSDEPTSGPVGKEDGL